MGQKIYPFNVIFATIKKEYIPIRHREGFSLSAGIGVITKDLIIFLYIKQFYMVQANIMNVDISGSCVYGHNPINYFIYRGNGG